VQAHVSVWIAHDDLMIGFFCAIGPMRACKREYHVTSAEPVEHAKCGQGVVDRMAALHAWTVNRTRTDDETQVSCQGEGG
jgi:hypothetical protein